MAQITSSKLATRVIGIDITKDKMDVSDSQENQKGDSEYEQLHCETPCQHNRLAGQDLC